MLDRPKLFWPWAFLGGQLIIAYFFQTKVTGIGFLLGYYLTLLFPLVFPIFLTSLVLPVDINQIVITTLNFYRNLILNGSELAEALGYLWPSIPLLIIFILPKKNKYLIMFLLMIHSQGLS